MYIQKNGAVYLTGKESFIPSQTLECGQCFRHSEIDKEYYVIPAFGKLLKIKQEKEALIFDTTLEEFERLWLDYFDLKQDYEKIKQNLSEDSVLKQAIAYASGIHILNQEFFECLISFIISQNNTIPRIKRIIKNICEKYGEFLGEIEGEKYFSFPTTKQLSKATAEDFMACNAGFRGSYIVDAVKKIESGEVDFSEFSSLSTEQLREKLMTIKGVGPKVADCVLLFSCGRKEVFPVDVWVKRVMSYFYFHEEETSIKEISSLAAEKYGIYAGFAQQYLFYYARENKIGKKKKAEQK